MKQKFYPCILLLCALFFKLSLCAQPFSLLKDIYSGASGSSYLNFTNVNGTLFFRPDDGVHGDELWKTNGTAAGTVLVKDIYPGTQGSDLQSFINVNGVLFFRADDGIHGAELWKSDGTGEGTVMVKDISSGPNSSFYSSLSNINGTIFFQANDGINGYELWKSDGTEAGTVMVKDIFPGAALSGHTAGTPNSGNPQSFTAVNNMVFFSAADDYDKNELWKTDGTTAGTVLIKDIYPGLTYSLNNFINLNGSLFFTVDGGGNGSELWKSDGTAAGTVMVKAFFGGNFDTHCSILSNALYFLESDGLWKSDGTEAGTILLKERGGAHAGSPELLTVVNGALYFTGYDDTHGWELWKSDGSIAGTVLLKDINTGANSSDINSFARIGNKLMFSANNDINGSEIWVSDGTAAGTKLVQDIDPGSGSAIPVQFYELKQTIIEANGKVYASVTTPDFGNEVWVSNIPSEISLPLEFLEFKGRLVNNDGVLEWKTENEANTVNFMIERSLDGQDYREVGVVAAANSNGLHHYNFTDPDIIALETAVIYYRLKQTDIGGSYTYSKIVTLAIEQKTASVILYPNPVLNEINLRIYSPVKDKLQWQLIDNGGRIIQHGKYELSAGNTAISENIGRLSSGVYFMRINGTSLQKIIKVIKQ